MTLPTVTRSVVVDVPPEEVWDALTDPDRLEDWFADRVEGELEAEGRVTFGWDDGERREAIVEEVDGPERLALWWWREGDEAGSRVTFELLPVERGTRVVVIETGVRAGSRLPQLAASCALALV